MANTIIILTVAVSLIQTITCQYIGNVGASLLPNQASVPLSLSSPALSSNLLPNTARFGTPISVTNPSTANLGGYTGSLANVVTASGGLATPPSTVVASSAFPTGLLANSAIATSGLSTPSTSILANANPTGLLTNSATSGAQNVLTVTSISPISPAGISVYADSIYLEGPLAVSGQLPFLGTIALDGSLASSGQGVATCGCGNGNIGMVGEGFPAGFNGLGGIGGSVSGGLVY